MRGELLQTELIGITLIAIGSHIKKILRRKTNMQINYRDKTIEEIEAENDAQNSAHEVEQEAQANEQYQQQQEADQ